jgi:hypothetical protein
MATTRVWVLRFMTKDAAGRIRRRVQKYRAKTRIGAQFSCARRPGRVILSVKPIHA